MNPYTQNLSRLEFIVTLACSGRCKHCSQGDHTGLPAHLSPQAAARAVRSAAACRRLDSLMTFGGEPLLCPQTVYAIHAAAADAGIPKRQLITNGYFSKDPTRISDVCKNLAQCGVNDVLLSADAFHQETIPLKPVMRFAGGILAQGIRLRVHPAWLVSRDDPNPYNLRTHEILAAFAAAGVAQSSGNVIFPSGNALRYLSAYFDPQKTYTSPYEEDPAYLHAICVLPDGSVLGGNIHTSLLADLIESYIPG